MATENFDDGNQEIETGQDGGYPGGEAGFREGTRGDHESGGTGLDSNVAGALAYLFGFVTGAIFFLVEKEDRFVRFHAAQSMVLSVGFVAVSVLLSVLGTVVSVIMFSGSTGGFFAGGIVTLLLGLVWLGTWFVALVLWVFLMVRAYQGKATRVPLVANVADRLVN